MQCDDHIGLMLARWLALRLSEVERAQRCGRAAGFASLRRSPRCGDSPALLDPRSHRETRFVRCAHCAQTVAMSQMTKRALARADPGSALLGAAAGAAPAAHPHLCVNRSGLFFGCTAGSSRSRGRVAGACASAAPRSAGARGLRIAARRGVERSLSEHRAQAACAAGCRPCEGEFCARPRAPSTAGQSALRADRRSEARPATRPRLCALSTWTDYRHDSAQAGRRLDPNGPRPRVLRRLRAPVGCRDLGRHGLEDLPRRSDHDGAVGLDLDDRDGLREGHRDDRLARRRRLRDRRRHRAAARRRDGRVQADRGVLRAVRIVRALPAGERVHPAADPVGRHRRGAEARGHLHRQLLPAGADDRGGGRQHPARPGRGGLHAWARPIRASCGAC